jgi:hypothetical protein
MTEIEQDILRRAGDYAIALEQFRTADIALRGYNVAMMLLLEAAATYRHPSAGIIAKAVT